MDEWIPSDLQSEVDRLTDRLRAEGWASHVTVERLVRSWDTLAAEVSNYAATIDDYTNDVTSRDALQEVVGWASPPLAAALSVPVGLADERFAAATTDDGGAAVGEYFRIAHHAGWWWRRRPTSGPLADYLDRP